MTAPPLRLTRQATHPAVSSHKSGEFDHHRAPIPHTSENRLSLQGAPPVDRPVRPQRMSWTASWRSQRPPRFWTDAMDATIEDQDSVAYAVADSVLGPAPPPIFPSIPFALPMSNERHVLDDDSTSDYSGLHGTGSEWSDDEDDAMIDNYQPVSFGEDDSPMMAYDSPVDGASPFDHSGSSPGPMTPFGEYIDRAIAVPLEDGHTTSHGGYRPQSCDPNCDQCQKLVAPPAAEKAAVPSVITTPTATEAYRKLADHLSEWVSDYVWKMCTVAPFSQAAPSTRPPSQLAASVRSVLLSTILQPSAVCLALKYISRLPVFLGPVILPADRRAEGDFRDVLLGHPEAHGRLEMENQAPFRLVVLGFMFANKWLDDHTFSNKTWHTITGLPLQWINSLESLALRVFNYDLSIAPSDWTHWLTHLQSYHSSLPAAPAQYPQPISRPGSSPHAAIRRMLDDLLDTQEAKICPDSCCVLRRYPQPVFSGFQERIQQRKSELELEEMDINLDEDGPLREEYLPKRRSSTSSLNRLSYASRTTKDTRRSSLIICTTGNDRTLPPPAKWSPDDDEPVHRPEDYVNRRPAAARPFHDPASMPASATQGAPPMQQWPVQQPYGAVPRIGFPAGNAMYAPPSAISYMPTYNNYAAPVRSPLGPSWTDGNYLRAFPHSAYNSASVWCRA